MTGGLVGGCTLVERARIFLKGGRSSSSSSSESETSPLSEAYMTQGVKSGVLNAGIREVIQRENSLYSAARRRMPLGSAVHPWERLQDCERDALRGEGSRK
jgi:hypothetical protein